MVLYKNNISRMNKNLSVDLNNILESNIDIVLSDDFDPEKIDNLATEVAKLYDSNKISYEEWDIIMNNIWGYYFTGDFFEEIIFPELAYNIFLAFDEWEYLKPVEKYTDPIIKNIVQGLK